MSFRWEIIPTAQIHPFVTFGVGMFMVGDLEKGRFYAAWRGDFVVPGISSRHYEGIEDKTVKDFIDESKDEGDEVKLPGVLPFLQLTLGLRGKISKNLHLLAEVGVWNGFILRGGDRAPAVILLFRARPDQRSLMLIRAIRVKIAEMIQKRTTILGSAIPRNW